MKCNTCRYSGERTMLYANGSPVAINQSSGTRGYLGKPYDSITGLYNYGYRDYSPQTVRFTTVDPIRDGSNWFTYVNNDPVNYVDLWGLLASDGKNDKIKVYVYRNLASYDISRDRSKPKNENLDTLILINNKTGDSLVVHHVQTVANYPSTKPDGTPAADSYPDTVAATSFSLVYKTTTNVASGPAAVISNTRTVSGKIIDEEGYTQAGNTSGRTLLHSPGKPDGTGDYRHAYSQACFIPDTSEDNQKIFDTLEKWGAEDGDVFAGKVINQKPWETKR